MGTRAVDSDKLIDDIGAAKVAQGNIDYGVARSHPVTGSEKLMKLLQLPLMRKTWEKAVVPLREAGGTDLPPLYNAEGKLTRSPTIEDIDLIKRTMDARIYDVKSGRAMDEAASYEKPTLGAWTDRRRELLEEVDELVPEYATARANQANATEQQEAIEFGQSLLDKKTLGRDIEKAFAELTPAQRQLAKKGAMDAIQIRILDAADSGAEHANVVKSIFGWGKGGKAKQLQALFGQKEFAEFERRMMAEINMVRTRNHVLGGSQTANKDAEAQDVDDLIQTAASAVVDVGGGNTKTGILRGTRELVSQGIDRMRTGYTEGVRTEVAKQIFNTDKVTDAEVFLGKLEEMRLQREAAMRGKRTASAVAGSMGGLVGGN